MMSFLSAVLTIEYILFIKPKHQVNLHFCSIADQFMSYLTGNLLESFSHNEAHIQLYKIGSSVVVFHMHAD